MKPQTLLVDFNPNRMFHLQEQKSQIYNVNVDKNGNSKLEDRIKDELRISPIIILNKDKLKEIVPEDILDAVREYSVDKSVIDEATDIPADSSLLTDDTIRKEIEELNPIDSSKGIDIKAAKGDGDDVDTPDDEKSDDQTKHEDGNPSIPNTKEDDDSLDKKLATYYAQILFFAFLTDSNVKSLEEIINVIDDNDDNQRLARNVGLRICILKIIQKKSNPFILSKLDYKIQNLNTLMKDTSLQPDERVEVAMKKFGRLSSSEIVTPMKIAKEMVDTLPEQEINVNTKILDIASKQGEFTRALYNKFGDKIKGNIYAIPTSTITFEFTRKVYSLLEMPIENIFSDFNSYDLIDNNKNETIIKKLKDMKFDVIIGNPPYQIDTKDTSDKSMYYLFVDVAYELSSKVCLITPARFLFNAGKTPKQWNKKMLNDSHVSVSSYKSKSSEVFPDIDLKGGVAITYRDTDKDFGAIGLYSQNAILNTILKHVITKINFKPISDIIYLQNKFNLECLYTDFPNYKEIIGSNGREKRLTTNIFELLDFFTHVKMSTAQIELIGLINNVRCSRFINKKYLESHQNTDCFKVLLPKTNNSGQLGEALSSPFVAGPGIGYTQSFIGFGCFKSEYEAENALKYIKTKFARTILGTLKVTQDNNKATWKNVPLQDFTSKSDVDWNLSIPNIDQQLYKKYKLSKDEINFIESTIKPME